MKIQLFDIDNWREIGSTLGRNKTRTFLTAFGIFWGVAMLALLHGGVSGLEGTLMRNFKGFATNTGGTTANVTSMPYKGYNKGLQWSYTLQDIEQMRSYSVGLDRISPLIFRYGNAAFGDKSKSVSINGVTADFFTIQTPRIDAGRILNLTDEHNKAKNAVIGKAISNELFGGDPEYAIGKYISVNNLYFRVVGVISQVSEASIGGRLDDMVTVPATTMVQLYNSGSDVDFIVFTAREGFTPADVFKDFRRVASLNHPVNPEDKKAFQEIDISEMFKTMGNVFIGVDLLAIFVGLGTLIAGIIGVGNIMWIIVRERTNEIGIRRAIGAKPIDIIIQVLSESMVLTSVAGIAGVCFASLILFVADRSTFDPTLGSAGFQLTFQGAVIILLTFMILGTIAGLVPATRAMRIKPVEAMRGK